MKKIYLILALLCIFVSIAGCSDSQNGADLKNNASEDDIKWDYRPMVYFDDKLYGETASFSTKLPDADFELVGEVLIQGKQHEPMKHEEGYSNSLPVGSGIYAADTEETIYIKTVHPSKDEGYIVYERLDQE